MAEVGKPSGLTRRKGSGSWYYRQRCPTSLLAPGIPAQVWISLDTPVYAEAIKRMDTARQEAARRFVAPAPVWSSSGISSRTSRPEWPLDPNLPILTCDQAAPLARSFFRGAVRCLDLEPSLPADWDQSQLAVYRAELSNAHTRLANLADDDLESGDLVVAAQRRVLKEAALRAERGGDASNLLWGYLRRAMVQIALLRLRRLDGDYSAAIDDALFAGDHRNFASHAQSAKIGRSTTTVAEAVDRFKLEVLDLRLVAAKTALKHQSLLSHVAAFFGRATALGGINRADCTRLRDALAKLPPNFAKRGLLLDGNAGTRNGGVTLAWETQNHYLRMADELFGWALKERLIADNPADGITPLKRREAADVQRLPFTAAELQRIFAAPVFTGCVDDGFGFARPGPQIIRRSRYWLPIIALFSGLRMGEILQLTPDHIRRSEGGAPFIVLTRDMKLKTAAAEREIPIHPMLERLGLLAWVNQRQRDGAADLFDDVPASKHGYRSDIFTKRFATFLKRIDLPPERRDKLCFHSFRHTFKDALNAAGTPEADMDELCGWSRGKSVGRRYGTGFSADRLKPYVDQVAYGVDLEHLTAIGDDRSAR